jgi:hypothetical protein
VGALGIVTALIGRAEPWLIVMGSIGPLLATAYLLSPAWRLRVVADEQALEVRRGGEVRFRLPWDQVTRVLAVPRWKVAFVDGGAPERSLLLPGPGAPAPYRLERREQLYEFILAHVDGAKVHTVDTLEKLPATP